MSDTLTPPSADDPAAVLARSDAHAIAVAVERLEALVERRPGFGAVAAPGSQRPTAPHRGCGWARKERVRRSFAERGGGWRRPAAGLRLAIRSGFWIVDGVGEESLDGPSDVALGLCDRG